MLSLGQVWVGGNRKYLADGCYLPTAEKAICLQAFVLVWAMGEIIYLADRARALRPAAQRTGRIRTDREKEAPAYEPLWRHLVGDHFRQVRQERGETLSQVATRAGVSPQYLSEVERGRKEPSSEMVAAISRALDLTLLDLTSAVTEALRHEFSSPLRGEHLMTTVVAA